MQSLSKFIKVQISHEAAPVFLTVLTVTVSGLSSCKRTKCISSLFVFHCLCV